jgi:hypothetical protein
VRRGLPKHAHDPLDPLLETAEMVDSFLVSRRPLIDRYRAGEVGIYVFLRTRVGDDYVAVVYWPLGTIESEFASKVSGRATPGKPRNAVVTARRRCLSIRSRS